MMPTLISSRYHIKWTQLADLPAPMYGAYAVVRDKKIYVAGGESPVDDALHQVYVYDINADHWGQLPPPGHYCGVPQVIGGKLAIIGGKVSATNERTNKVSTFDETSQTWTSHYPDLLLVRSRPGVITHLEHVIVAGGAKGDDTKALQNDIEVLNWIENSHWRKVAINLPQLMWGFKLSIAGDHLLIVGYDGIQQVYNGAYKIPVVDITRSGDQQHTSDPPTEWITMTCTDHWYTALVPSSSPPVVVGGRDQNGIATSDVKMYDDSSKSWKNIASLSSARARVAIAAVNNSAIIVIGGYTKGGNVATATISSVVKVELGQAELVH